MYTRVPATPEGGRNGRPETKLSAGCVVSQAARRGYAFAGRFVTVAVRAVAAIPVAAAVVVAGV